jgi:hypothetical protein
MKTLTKKARIDGQVTGLAGEFFVAGELLKRGLQTSVTFGNAKSIDLLAFHPGTGRTFTVQVKALRTNGCFPIKRSAIEDRHIYVFVLLNPPGRPVNFFVVPGTVLLAEPHRFGRDFQHRTFPGILARDLHDFLEAWDVFENAA